MSLLAINMVYGYVSAKPTTSPTAEPTPAPSAAPTAATAEPTPAPTEAPSIPVQTIWTLCMEVPTVWMAGEDAGTVIPGPSGRSIGKFMVLSEPEDVTTIRAMDSIVITHWPLRTVNFGPHDYGRWCWDDPNFSKVVLHFNVWNDRIGRDDQTAVLRTSKEIDISNKFGGDVTDRGFLDVDYSHIASIYVTWTFKWTSRTIYTGASPDEKAPPRSGSKSSSSSDEDHQFADFLMNGAAKKGPMNIVKKPSDVVDDGAKDGVMFAVSPALMYAFVAFTVLVWVAFIYCVYAQECKGKGAKAKSVSVYDVDSENEVLSVNENEALNANAA